MNALIISATPTTNLTQQPCVVTGLIQSGIDVHMINITWNVPTVSHSVIIMYEIRYRELNSNGPYSMTYTINTQYSIVGLLPYTNYTIGVRAYTSVGPGEWTDKQFDTIHLPGKYLIQLLSIITVRFSCRKFFYTAN